MNRGIMEWLFYMAVGYLMGSLLFSYFLPKYFKNIDVEKESMDHNPGTANVMKHAGLPLGFLCLLLDMGKGYLPVFWAGKVLPPVSLWFAGVMAAPVLGHAFPFWRNRSGGKAIAVSFGVLFGILRYSVSVWILASLYIVLVLIPRIRPNERKSVYTFLLFGGISAAALFLGHMPGICIGNILIAAIVICRNWEGACFREKSRERLERAEK